MQQMNILSAITTQDPEINNKSFDAQQEGSNENTAFSSLVDKEVAKSRNQDKQDELVKPGRHTSAANDKAVAATNDNSSEPDGKISSSTENEQTKRDSNNSQEHADKSQRDVETKVTSSETQSKEDQTDKTLTQSQEFISLLYQSDQALNSSKNKQESNSVNVQSQSAKEAMLTQQNSDNEVPVKTQTKTGHTLKEFIESLPSKPIAKDSNATVTNKEALAQSLKNQQLTPEALAAKQQIASEQKASSSTANSLATQVKPQVQQEAPETKVKSLQAEIKAATEVKSLQAEIKTALAGGEEKVATEQGKNALLLDESTKASKHSKSEVAIDKVIQQAGKVDSVTNSQDAQSCKQLLSNSQDVVEESDAVEQAITKTALSAEKSISAQDKDAVAISMAKSSDKESKATVQAGNAKVTQKAGEVTEHDYSATKTPPIIKPEESKAVAMANTSSSEINQSRVINSRTESALQTPQQQSEQLNNDNNSELESKTEEQEAELQIRQTPSMNDKNSTGNTKSEVSVAPSQNHTRVMAEPLNYNSALNQASQAIQVESLVHNVAGDVAHIQKNNVALQQETISIFRKDFANAVKDKVMLVISQKLQQFDITLDPPEFGNMQVRVNLQAEQASVNFVVQNQQAKDALEQNMHKLRDMLSEQGVDVGGANVEQQNSQGSDEEQNLAGEGNARDTMAQDDSEATEHLLSAGLFNSSATGVDYFV